MSRGFRNHTKRPIFISGIELLFRNNLFSLGFWQLKLLIGGLFHESFFSLLLLGLL